MDLFLAIPFLSIDQISSHEAPDRGRLRTIELSMLPNLVEFFEVD